MDTRHLTVFAGWLAGLTVCLSPPHLRAENDDGSSEDPLALARILLHDGLPDRAHAALASIESEDVKSTIEYSRLLGLSLFELHRYPEAVHQFDEALRRGDQDGSTQYALVRALFADEKYEESLRRLRTFPASLYDRPDTFRLEAALHYKLGDKHSSYAALHRGLSRFPTDEELQRQRIRMLIDLRLFLSASASAERFLNQAKRTSKDYLTIAEALRESGAKNEALRFLELASLRFPDERDVRLDLAKLYLERGNPFAAARILHPLALLDSEQALYTAELYRRAKHVDEAIWLNRLVGEQPKKIRQRVNLLIEAERYEEAAALDERITRLNLLQDDKLAYALAYSQYLAGNFSRAEQLIRGIQDSTLFDKGVALRRAMELCSLDPWQCE